MRTTFKMANQRGCFLFPREQKKASDVLLQPKAQCCLGLELFPRERKAGERCLTAALKLKCCRGSERERRNAVSLYQESSLISASSSEPEGKTEYCFVISGKQSH